MSRRVAVIATALVVLLGFAPVAPAQGIVPVRPLNTPLGRGYGSCQVGRGFECSDLRASERPAEGTEKEWYRAVVLWRTDEDRRAPGMMPDTLRARMVMEQHRSLRRAAEDRGRVAMGSNSMTRWWFAEITGGDARDPRKPRSLDTLEVLGESFIVPMRDTVVVVMVDGTEGGETPARLAGSVRVPTIVITATSKTWRSGDTTFFVRPPPASRRELETFLRAIPEVRAFLER